MPRISVNPDVQSASGFPLWGEGTYDLRVKQVDSTTASTGKAQLKLRLEPVGEVPDEQGVALGNPGTLVDYVTVDPIQGKNGGTFSFLRALWEAAGLAWGADIDTDLLLDRVVKAKVNIEKDQKGNDRNRIKRYVKAS